MAAPQSHAGEFFNPHLWSISAVLPCPVKRRLSLHQLDLGRLEPGGRVRLGFLKFTKLFSNLDHSLFQWAIVLAALSSCRYHRRHKFFCPGGERLPGFETIAIVSINNIVKYGTGIRRSSPDSFSSISKTSNWWRLYTT